MGKLTGISIQGCEPTVRSAASPATSYAKEKVSTLSPADREVQKNLEAYHKRILLENSVLPDNHPLSVEANRISAKLRQAALKDPLWKKLGVKLPDKFRVFVLNTETLEAFVIPERPDEVYISTGMLKTMEDWAPVSSILAHEQGHTVQTQIAVDTPKCLDERFGEKIWRDPSQRKPGQSSVETALKRLTSRGDETWCDTFGSYHVLDAAGISPESQTTADYKLIAVSEREPGRFDKTSAAGVVGEALKTHPPSEERIVTGRRILQTSAFPTTLAGKVPANPVTVDVPLKSADEVIDFIYTHTPVLQYVISRDLGTPQIRAAGIRSQDEDSFKNQDGYPCYNTFHKAFEKLSPVQQMSVRSALEFSINAVEKCSVELEWQESSDCSSATRATLNRHQKEKCSGLISSDYIAGGHFILTPSQALEIDRLAPGISYKPEDLHDALKRRLKKGIYLLDFSVDSKKGHPVLVSLVNTRQMKMPLTPESNGSLQSFRDRRLVYSCREWGKKNEFPDFNHFISWLKSFKDAQAEKVTALGCAVTDENILDMALSYSVNCTDSSTTAEERFAAIRELCGVPSKFTERFLDSNNPNWIEKLTDDDLGNMLSFWPEAANRLLQQRALKKSTLAGDLIDPNLPPELSRTAENLHDRESVTACDVKTRKPCNFNEEFERKEGQLLEDYLSRLEKLPHIFSSEAWEGLAEKAVRSPSELLCFCEFIDKSLSSPQGHLLPGLERQRMRSLSAVVESTLQRFSETGEIDFSKPDVVTSLIDSLRIVPRNSNRNRSVQIVLDGLAAQSGFETHTLTWLARMIETEPPEEMLRQHLNNLKHDSNRQLLDVETALSISPYALIPVEFLEKPFSPKKKLRLLPLYSPNAPDLRHSARDDASRKEVDEADDHLENLGFVRHVNEDSQPLSQGEINRAYAKVYFRDDGVSRTARRFKVSWMNESEAESIPHFATREAIRHQALTAQKTRVTPPVNPVSMECSALAAAEDIAGTLTSALGIQEPEQCDPFARVSRPLSENDLENRLSELEIAQPVPTPLRDRWYLETLEQYRAAGGPCDSASLMDFQEKLYLPKNRQAVGEIIWNDFVAATANEAGNVNAGNALDLVRSVFPEPCEARNRILSQIREKAESVSYVDARLIQGLHWEPGLPLGIPSAAQSGADASAEFQANLLKSFGDFEAVEFLFYSFGVIKEKPWPVEYMEYSLGGTLSDLVDSNRQAKSFDRRVLLHQLFDGPEGIFMRADPATMNLISSRVAECLSLALNLDDKGKAAVRDLADDVFSGAGFSAHERTELLSILADWMAERSTETDPDQRTAELIMRTFSVLKAPGYRFLQGLLIEPNLFSESVARKMRKAQDDTPPADPLVPFHLARIHGVNDLTIGPALGKGSMAEVYEILSANGAGTENTVGKFLRPDTLTGLSFHRAPLRRISSTLQKHGYGWSPELVDRILESVREESALMGSEAARTGLPIAGAVSSALDGNVEPCSRGIRIDFNAPGTERPLSIVVPESRRAGETPASEGQKTYFFSMSSIGRDARPLSRLAREMSKEELARYLDEQGLSMPEISASAVMIFVQTFLSGNLLFKDLHKGNFAVIPADGEYQGQLALMDFGSVEEKVDPYWRGWIIRLFAHAGQQDWQSIRQDLLEVAVAAEGAEELSPEKVEKLDRYLKRIEKDLAGKDSFSFDGIMSTLQDLTGFLYQDWPMPAAVADFAESLRKVAREWAPWLDEEGKAAIGMNLAAAMMQASSDGIEPREEYLRMIERFEKTGGDETAIRYEQAKENAHVEWFIETGAVPKGSIIHVKDEDGAWKGYRLKNDADLGSEFLNYSHVLSGESEKYELGALRLSDEMEGYIEASDHKGLYLITISKFLEIEE